MKLAAILYFASFLKKKRTQVSDMWNGFIPYMSLLGVIVFLLALQPDF
jgi:cell division protein FtsW (lipid II flippase)